VLEDLMREKRQGEAETNLEDEKCQNERRERFMNASWVWGATETGLFIKKV